MKLKEILILVLVEVVAAVVAGLVSGWLEGLILKGLVQLGIPLLVGLIVAAGLVRLGYWDWRTAFATWLVVGATLVVAFYLLGGFGLIPTVAEVPPTPTATSPPGPISTPNLTPPPTPTLTSMPAPEIRITYPVDGDSVPRNIMVQGTSANIPEGYQVWVLIYPHTAPLFFPQSVAATVDIRGEWTSPAYIGLDQPDQIGLLFDIVAVLADQNAQNVFKTYVAQGMSATAFPGLSELPDGAVEYDRITVIRR